MCKYCAGVEKSSKDEDLDIPAIYERDFRVEICGVKTYDDKSLPLFIETTIEPGGYLETLLYDGHACICELMNKKIKYCPMCGRKF